MGLLNSPQGQPMPPQGQPMPPPQQAQPASAESAPMPQQERKINGMTDQEHFGRIATAGLKILYAPKMIAILKPIINSGEDYSQALAERIVILLKMIDEKVKYKFPRSLMIPIALYITMDFLKWMKDNDVGNLTPEIAKSVIQQVPEMLIAEYKMIDASVMGNQQPPMGNQQPVPQ